MVFIVFFVIVGVFYGPEVFLESAYFVLSDVFFFVFVFFWSRACYPRVPDKADVWVGGICGWVAISWLAP